MICYRYFSWSSFAAVETRLVDDVHSLGGHLKYRNDCIDLWIPIESQWFLALRYPDLVRQQNLDY
jgi:hypothetical protein